MKPFIVRRSSWHWYLANFGTSCHADDICAYTREVLAGAWLVALCSTLIGGFTAVLSDLLGYLLATLFNWSLIEPRDLTAGTLIVLGVVAVFVTVFLLRERVDVNVRAPSFVREAYASWKDKYCVEIEVTGRRD